MNPIAPPTTEDQVLKLRQLVNVLNKKHQESLLTLTQRESEFNDAHKYVQEAREQAQKAQEEAHSFKTSLENLQQQFQDYKDRIGDHHVRSSEADDEIKALRLQHVQLMEKLKTDEEQIKQLEEALIESKQTEQQLERVIQFLRQRGEESHLEMNEIEQELQNTKAALASLNDEVDNHRRTTQDLNSALDEEKRKTERLEQALVDLEQNNPSQNISTEQFEELQELRNILELKDQKIRDLEERIASSSEPSMGQEDQNIRLRLIQQHLAKKVRETTLLSEKIDEQKNVVNELQNAINDSRVRTHELETTLQLERQHHQKMQTQMEESLKMTESSMRGWEEKYTAMHARREELDQQNREFRQFEEKYGQIKAMVASLNLLMENKTP